MIDNERDLFVRTLEELYHLERELEELQPELADAATDEDLEEFFMAHGERTTEQVGRLERIFDALEGEVEPGPVESPALDGLRSEREALVGDLQDPTLGDLVEAELGRTIERLEISKLETLLTVARRTDLPDEVVGPLETTKQEAENGLERLQDLTS
ncbi:DUF892 family protein [Halobiforma nitratireducens]|nr:DUF892 family protein [Halobiforma nitratireducens]